MERCRLEKVVLEIMDECTDMLTHVLDIPLIDFAPYLTTDAVNLLWVSSNRANRLLLRSLLYPLNEE